jgi:hypothetical protein
MSVTLMRGKTLNGPDQHIVQMQLQGLQEMYKIYGRRYCVKNLLFILRKNPEPDTVQVLPSEHWNRRLVPFRFNRIQRDLDESMGLRNICNKPRQAGYTTFFINTRLYLPALIEPGSGGLLMSQNSRYATAHFGILKRAHRYVGCIDPWKQELNVLHRQLLQHLLHTSSSNRKEIIFDQLDSRILIESAEVPEAGQGFTLNHVVCTEVARWPGNPEETMANMKEAIAEGGTLDIESTPNGLGGYYCEEFKRAELGGKDCEFRAFFHPWFWHDEYRIEQDSLEEEELNEEEQRKQQLFNLSLEQMTWRRKKMVSLRHNFKEKYPEDSTTCFLTSGRLFFDQEILAARIAELSVYKPLSIERNGEVVVFQKPKPGRLYIFGMDPAEGKGIIQAGTEVGDWSCGKMIDQETGEECLSYRSRLAPEDFAADGVEICQYYNDAMFACERNNHGGTVILAARELGYGNIYRHREWHRRSGGPRREQTKAGQASQRVVEFEGWPTNVKTRKILLNKLGWFIRNHPETIWDMALVQECFTFIYDEHGRPAAMEGYHDDGVFAAAIAHAVRLVNLGYLDPLTYRSVGGYGTFSDTEEDMETVS